MWAFENGGGVRHKGAPVPFPTLQWSGGALRQPPPTSLLLLGKVVLLPGQGPGAPFVNPEPILAALSHLLVLITRITTLTILIDYTYYRTLWF